MKKLLVCISLLLVCLCHGKNECIKGLKDDTSTQHCPACKPSSDDVQLNITKLTVGDETNTIYDDDLGQVCIEGSAKVKLGYMRPTDTLDLRLKLSFEMYTVEFPIHCSIPHGFIENILFPERYSGGSRLKNFPTPPPGFTDDFAWVKKVFGHFNMSTCTVQDICGMLKPGEGLREQLDNLIDNSTVDLDVFDNYNTSDDNVCSADFLEEKIKSLNECYKLGNPGDIDISMFKELAVQDNQLSVRVTIELLKRDTTIPPDQQADEHVLCLYMPLKVKFRT